MSGANAALGWAVQPGGLSAANHNRIHALAERGWSARRIARAIEKNPGTVLWFMYRAGLKKARQREEAFQGVRAGRAIKSYTRDEDAFITALRVQGIGLSEIARLASTRFGHSRSAHSVHVRLTMLASDGDQP